MGSRHPMSLISFTAGHQRREAPQKQKKRKNRKPPHKGSFGCSFGSFCCGEVSLQLLPGR